MTRTFHPEHTYSTDLLITSIALALGRPVEMVMTEKGRGMAHEYVINDGGTRSVEFRYGCPPDTDTGQERCVFTRSIRDDADPRGTYADDIHRHTLEQAVAYIVESAWARVASL